MDNDNLFNVAFRKFGGLNYSANNNVTHSTYSNATNMLVSNQVGAKNTNIIFQSNADMSNSSFFNIDTAYFEATTVTSQNGALTFNNTSGSTGLNFNVASGTTYRFNTTGGRSIAIHEQTISTASGDLSFTAPSTNTIFIDPDITVPKITTRPGTDLFITTGSPDGHIRADRIIDISGNVIETGDSLFIGAVGITGTLGVTGPSTFNGNVGITGVFGVTGPSTFNGTVGITGLFGVTGVSSFNNLVGITGFLGVTGTTNINNYVGITGLIGVTGSSVFNGSVIVGGTIGVTGRSEFDGNVGIIGVNGVTGRAIFNGSVGITGPIGITGQSIFDQSVHILGNMNAHGTSVFDGTVGIVGPVGITGAATFDGMANVIGPFGTTGIAVFDGQVDIRGPFEMAGSSEFNGSVGISGPLRMNGDTRLDGTANIVGPFGATGVSTFNDHVGMVGSLGVTGPSTLNGSVGITGIFGATGKTILDGSVGIAGSYGVTGSCIFDGSVGITGSFGITGPSTFNGTVGVSGAFGITGPTILNGKTNFIGNIQFIGDAPILFNNGVDIEGTLGITGPSTFNGPVGVAGTFGVTGSSTLNGDVTINGPLTIDGSSSIFHEDLIISEVGSFTSNDGHTFADVMSFSVVPISRNFGEPSDDVLAIKRYVDDKRIPGSTFLYKNNIWGGTNKYNTMFINNQLGITDTSTINEYLDVTVLFGVTGASTFNGPVGITGAFGVTGVSTFDGPVGVIGAFGVTGETIFNGPVGITGSLSVIGASVFNSPVGITGLFGVTGSSTFDGSVGITGLFGVTGEAVFNGTVGVTGSFGVTGSSIFNGSVGITGLFGVTGSSIFNGTVGITGLIGVTGSSIFNGSVGMTGLIGVTGTSIFNGTVGVTGAFGVTGPSAFNGSVGVLGPFGVTGPSTFDGFAGVTGRFGVTGASVFNELVGVTGSFGVTGPSTFNGSVEVTGLIGVTGTSTFNGSFDVIGDLEIIGSSSFEGPIGINNAFGVTGASTFNGSVGITGSFGVTGRSIFDGTVGIAGGFGVTGGSVFNGLVGITGGFGVTGSSVFNGSVGVIGLIGVTGETIFDGSVGIAGLFGVTGETIFDGSVGITGRFGVTGASVFNGSVGVTGLFGVTGSSIFNGSVGVSGPFVVTSASIFNGSVGITGAFGVTGSSTFDGSVGVSGPFVVTSASIFNGSVGITGAFGLIGGSIFNGSVGISGEFGVTGASVFNGSVGVLRTFNAARPSTFNGSVGVTGAFGVTGPSTFNGSVGITGIFGVTGTSAFDGSVGVSGAFGVTGSSVFNGSVGITGRFGVTGASVFNGSVGVTGAFGVTGSSVFNGSVGVTGAFGVTGSSVFNGSVGVTGAFGVTGETIFNGSVGVTGSFGVTGETIFDGSVSVSGAFGVTGASVFNGSIRIRNEPGENNYFQFPDGTQQTSASAIFEQHINQDVYGITRKKSSITYNFVPRQQSYSVKNNIPDMWVAGSDNSVGAGLNNLSYSSDGINWNGLGKDIFSISGDAVAWNGQMWVACGSGSANTLAYSYDGKKWVGLGRSIFTNGKAVAWNGQMWVAGGDGVTIAYSYDGINWTGIASSPFYIRCEAVEWNGQMWLAGGTSDGIITVTNSNLAYSYDGINWTGITSSPFTGNCGALAWDGQMWVAGGQGGNSLAYSSNGINWTGITPSPFTFACYAVAWNGQMWVAGGQGGNTLAYSSNGIIWTGITSSPFTAACYSVAWNGKMWVAGGSRGDVAPSFNSLAYSYDGIIWTGLGASALNYRGLAVAFNTIRRDIITSSSKNTCITSRNVVASIDNVVPRQQAYSFGKNIPNMWVAGGYNGPNTLAYSYDGINWVGLGNSVFNTGCTGIEWNGTMWVAAGVSTSCKLAYSYDGINWTSITAVFDKSGSGYGNCIKWNGTMWVAGGRDNVNSKTYALAYSYDGINWTTIETTAIFGDDNRNTCTSLMWSGRSWFAVNNQNNLIAQSFDGINWAQQGSNLTSNYFIISNGNISLYSGLSLGVCKINYVLNSTFQMTDKLNFAEINYIEWNGELFVAGGSEDASNNNTLAWSYDGITWNYLGTTIFKKACYGISWNGTMWISCGTNANAPYYNLAYSYDGKNWTIIESSGNLFQTFFLGGNGGRCAAFNGARPNTITFPSNNILIGSAGSQALMKVPNPHGLPPSTTIDASQNLSTYLSTCNCVTWNGSMWVAVGSNTTTPKYSIAASADGIIWTGIDASNTLFSTGKTVAWNGTMWVAGGTTTKSYPIAYSYDSYTWIGLETSIFTSVNSIAYNDNDKFWVAVGTGGTSSIAYSDDGITWTLSGANIAAQGNAVAWNGYMWVAGFTNDASYNNTLAYSYDGAIWYGLGDDVFSTSCLTLDWNGQFWVAGGLGTNVIAYSSDGINWNPSILPANTLTSATSIDAYNNEFIVAGANTSSTGTLFSNNSGSYPISAQIFNGIAYNSALNKWVAVGNSSVATSTDGANWATASITTTGLSTGRCIASDLKGNNYKWIAGGVTSGVGGFVRSSDAITWSAMDCITTQFATSTPLTTVKSIACYYDASFPYGQIGKSHAKWVAVCEGSAKIASAVNTYTWNPVNNSNFDNITGFATGSIVIDSTRRGYCMIVGNKSNAAVINISSGISSTSFTPVSIPTNANGLIGMTGCNAVAANAASQNFLDFDNTTGTTKFVVVGTGYGTFDASYSGVTPIYEFDKTGNYIYGANPVTLSGVTYGYSTYLRNGTQTVVGSIPELNGDTTGYTKGNAVACNANANTYGDVKWVIAGQIPYFAHIYVGRFASKWSANAVSQFTLNDCTVGNLNVYMAGQNNDGTNGAPIKWTSIPSFNNNPSWSFSTLVSGSTLAWANMNVKCIEFLHIPSPDNVNVFIAGTSNSSGPNYILMSKNGFSDWYNYEVEPAVTPPVNCVAVNKISQTTGSTVRCIAVTNAGFYYYTHSKLVTTISSDWYVPNNSRELSWPSNVSNVMGISCLVINANIYWVAVGVNIAHSTNGGTDYNPVSYTGISQMNAVANNQYLSTTLSTYARWVVVGNNTLGVTIGYTTTETGGNGWTSVPNSNVFFTNGKAVTCNTNMWIASGTKNAGGYLHFAFSYDGISWFSLGDFSKTLSSCNSIKYMPATAQNTPAPSQIIAVGPPATTGGTNYTVGDMSSNAIAWSMNEHTLSNNYSVAYNPYAGVGEARWVVVGIYNVGEPNVFNGSITTSEDGINWLNVKGFGVPGADTNVHISNTTALNSVVHGFYGIGNAQNKWVAVGNCASASSTNHFSILYSSNGKTSWTGVTNSSFISTSFKSVTFTGLMFVAVTSDTNAKFAFSYDGMHWFAGGVNNNITALFIGSGWQQEPGVVGRSTNSTNNIYSGQYNLGDASWYNLFAGDTNAYNCVACNNSATIPSVRWVVVGNTKYYTSANGIDWTGPTSYPTSTLTNGYGVACNNNTRWVIVGSGTNSIIYSDNATTWTPVANSSSILAIGAAVAWSGSYFVAAGTNGSIALSNDGAIWSVYSYTPINYISSIKWNGFYWNAAGLKNNNANGCLAYSTDSKYWKETTQSLTLAYPNALNTIGWTSKLSNINIKHPIIAVGSYTGSKTAIAYSIDGYKWINVGAGIFTTGNAVAWNGTMWVAVGQGVNAIAYSYDGLNWVGLGINYTSGKCIAWNGTMWLAGFSNGRIAYSYNGMIWTAVSQISSISQISYFTSCNAIAWNGTQWCAGGTSDNSCPIITSYDGFTWEEQSTSLTSCNDIKSNGQMWVAAGAGGIRYSYNGTNWFSISTAITNTIIVVAWNGKMWLAGGAGTIKFLSSTNGIDWTNLGNIFTTWCTAIAWTGDKWIAGGLNGSTSLFITSYDSITWNNVSQTPMPLTAINGISGNPRIGATVLDSQLMLSSGGPGLDNTLDIVSGSYYQPGYTNMETTIISESQPVGTFQDLNDIFGSLKGITWQAMGTGTSGNVLAISAVDNSNVYVGGQFIDIGGDTNKKYIAKWDGVTWQAMGTGVDSKVNAISAVNNSNVYVGGNYTDIGGDTNKKNIARWDGATWQAMGTGANGQVWAVSALDNSNVYIVGDFILNLSGTNATRVAKWDGASWRVMGSGLNNTPLSIFALDNSNVYAGGLFKTADGRGASFIARWDGASWQAMGQGTSNIVWAISAKDNSNVYVGGQFTNIGGDTNKSRVARWDGATWQTMGTGTDSSVLTISALDNSNVYVGGQFLNIGGDNNKRYIAKWDGATWQRFGSGSGVSNIVNTIYAYDKLNVYVGGNFTSAGGVANTNYIAKWTNEY